MTGKARIDSGRAGADVLTGVPPGLSDMFCLPVLRGGMLKHGDAVLLREANCAVKRDFCYALLTPYFRLPPSGL